MTAALVLVGGCQIATGGGLAGVRLPARLLLILTGLSTLGIAASPEPATGPTARHLAFAVSFASSRRRSGRYSSPGAGLRDRGSWVSTAARR